MKCIHLLLLSTVLFLVCSCPVFYGKQSPSDQLVRSPEPLVVPVGKHWQIIEEPPRLSDERGRLPFQTEQSLQPDAARPVTPEDNRKIETSH
jgi:hypothetical protein